MNYKRFEYYINFMEEKRQLLQKYNTENGTLYHFYFECLHKEYIGGTTTSELARAFDSNRNTILLQIKKMGVESQPHGGNKKPLLTVQQIRDIRASKLPNNVLAKQYNYAPSGICNIKNRKQWANI